MNECLCVYCSRTAVRLHCQRKSWTSLCAYCSRTAVRLHCQRKSWMSLCAYCNQTAVRLHCQWKSLTSLCVFCSPTAVRLDCLWKLWIRLQGMILIQLMFRPRTLLCRHVVVFLLSVTVFYVCWNIQFTDYLLDHLNAIVIIASDSVSRLRFGHILKHCARYKSTYYYYYYCYY